MIYSDSHVHFTKINTIECLSLDMHINCVTNTVQDYRLASKLYGSMKNITVSAGYHPLYYTQSCEELDDYLSIISKERFIGEIGLDIKATHNMNYQKEVLREIIRTANLSGAQVINLHNRKTLRESMDIISEFKGITIFHRFSGNVQDYNNISNNPNWYVSINPMLITNYDWREIKKIPIKQILLESDAPFTLKESNIYDITYIISLYNLMAKNLAIKVENLVDIIASNYLSVYRVSDSKNFSLLSRNWM